MAKPFTIIIYTLIAFFLLLLISHSPKKPSNHHRHLKLRSSFNLPSSNHQQIPFDPIVADIERRREDKEWERRYFEQNHKEFLSSHSAPGHELQPEWEDTIDAEDYLNDDERFNITNRIVLLFPRIDLDPVDGFVSSDELTEWNMRTAEKEVLHRTVRDMEVHDKNRDGFVSFQEYEPPSWVRLSSSDNSSNGDGMGWWRKDHFNSSDEDGDGLLNRIEFNNFLHPADSKNPRLLRWLCREEIRERDTDKDGKLNFQEFFRGLFDSIRNYDEVGNNFSHSDNPMEASAKNLFAQLDSDNDGYLSEEELLPIIDRLHPSERYYAKQQADYVITQADTDKDGRLSLNEMIENPYVFYSAIFNDEDDYGQHDEFR
ncbi:calcium-binding EF hand family protein [Tasmannia lanceolata]|uniref:calcium-binding EF hand family protein n=1 Tax=Tasmannia lanceolata TaxID=3420 RepID=UPI004063A888